LSIALSPLHWLQLCDTRNDTEDSAKTMNRYYCTAIGSLLTMLATAVIAGPVAEISSQLSGLHITYHKEDSAVRTILYATNHEAYAVICDSEMRTNIEQNKKKQNEIRIAAGETAPFMFYYSRGVTKLNIYLICVPTEEKAIVEAEGKVDGSASEQATDRIVVKKRKKPEETVKTVPVEDLGQF